MPSFEKKGEREPAKALSRSPTASIKYSADAIAMLNRRAKLLIEAIDGDKTRANFTPHPESPKWQWCVSCQVYHRLAMWWIGGCPDKDWAERSAREVR